MYPIDHVLNDQVVVVVPGLQRLIHAPSRRGDQVGGLPLISREPCPRHLEAATSGSGVVAHVNSSKQEQKTTQSLVFTKINEADHPLQKQQETSRNMQKHEVLLQEEPKLLSEKHQTIHEQKLQEKIDTDLLRYQQTFPYTDQQPSLGEKTRPVPLKTQQIHSHGIAISHVTENSKAQEEKTRIYGSNSGNLRLQKKHHTKIVKQLELEMDRPECFLSTVEQDDNADLQSIDTVVYFDLEVGRDWVEYIVLLVVL